MAVDYDKLNFYTGANYMKRSDKSGQSTIAGSAVDVDHSLGYVPQFLTFADLDNNGILWYGGERVFAGTESTSGGWSYPPMVDSWVTDQVLTMYPSNIGSSRPVHWLIYLDYSGA